MENCNHARIISTWMSGQLKMHIPSPWSPNWWTRSKMGSILPNWTSDGATTTSESRKGTNGKPRSKPIEDCMNPPWCFSECATLPPRFRRWWTTSLKTYWRGNCNNLHGRHVFISKDKGAIKGKHQTGPAMTNGKRLIPETQEMRILQRKNQMVRNGYTGRKDHHGSQKIKRNSRLASSHNS